MSRAAKWKLALRWFGIVLSLDEIPCAAKGDDPFIKNCSALGSARRRVSERTRSRFETFDGSHIVAWIVWPEPSE